MNLKDGHECFEFDGFRLDARHLLLFRDSVQIDLAPKVVETLVALVQNNGHILNKDELMQAVWPDTIVDESNIFQNLYLLRKTLGNKPDGTPYIETLRRRGYRFSADARVARSADIPSRSTSEPLLTTVRQHPNLSETLPLRPDRQFTNGGLIICAAVLLCLIVTGVASVFYRPWNGISVEANAQRQMPSSVAVLPFRNATDNMETRRLSFAICDALITRLGNEHKIAVRPTNAVRPFTDPNQDSTEIGRMQGVEAVLDGSIQQDAGRVRVTTQLIDTLTGVTIWSSQFDAKNTNDLDIQDNISQRVIAEMTRSLAVPD